MLLGKVRSPQPITCLFSTCSLQITWQWQRRFPLTVHLFKPKTKMGITGLQSWLQRRPAEFKQQDFACQSEGREGTGSLCCSTRFRHQAITHACTHNQLALDRFGAKGSL